MKIFVTFQKEGIHCYPEAATDPKLATGEWDDVSFLATPHRHMFHFRVELDVHHDNRDIEFIQLKRRCERWYDDGVLTLDSKSCEMMARELNLRIRRWLVREFSELEDSWARQIRIEVSEDGENGAILESGIEADI